MISFADQLPASRLMKAFRNLELHVVHGCNLACESCSHYSNHGHNGCLAIDEADQWMSQWSSRLKPKMFTLLGGEPTIHPGLSGFFPLVRAHWPETRIRLTTNGFFLHRHPDLPRVLRGDRNCHIHLSIHHDAPKYMEKLKPVFDLLGDWEQEFGIEVVYVKSHRGWSRTYHGFGADMRPYNDQDIRSSWEHCRARTCPQLFEGRIWKCGPIAYLGMQDARYHLSEDWRPYLDYEPLNSGCSDEELEEFFDREEESCCGMCPASKHRLKLAIPLKNSFTPKTGIRKSTLVA